MRRNILLLLLFNLATAAHAYSWPRFSVPDKTMLMALGGIDTKTCPPGQGKLVLGFAINIRDYLCRSYCPKSWKWVVHGDDVCHSLTAEFEFKGFDISYLHDEDGLVNRSIVNAKYVDKNQQDGRIFQLLFESDMDEHWFCVKATGSVNLIECANDI